MPKVSSALHTSCSASNCCAATQDKEQAYKEFLAGNPSLEDFENELKRYMTLEIEIGQITSSYTIGSLSLQTTHLKNALKKEAMEWKAQYAKNLHMQARGNLESILFEMVCCVSACLEKRVLHVC